MSLIGWSRLCSRPLTPLTLNVNRLNTSLCSVTCRYYCAQPPNPSSPPPPPPRPPGGGLMNFPRIVWPSFILSCKNWIYTNFIIKPHFDQGFNIYNFVESSKQAVQVISSALHESDFNSLRELVSEEAYAELYHSVTQMSLAERENLAVDKKDIYLSFPYQIGIIFDNDNEQRWVEITMVYHSLKGFSEMKDRGEMLPLTLGSTSRDQVEKLFICNYRFIREYTKGKTDTSWLVNVVNHFKEFDSKGL